MRSGNIDQLIHEAESLHSAPGIAQSLLNLTKRPDFDIREVVDCLERDPRLRPDCCGYSTRRATVSGSRCETSNKP